MPDVQTILEERLRAAVTSALGENVPPAIDPQVRPSGNPQFGDYQANLAMGLAKAMGRKPRELAQLIVDKLEWKDIAAEPPGIAGPGFINLKLSATFIAGQLAAAACAGDALGVPKAEHPQSVVVDYSGPNVAKEMHVGHLRSTIIGDAIARVLAFQGHRVTRQNHMGDWGTQFGMLIEHLGPRELGDLHIGDLNAFYQEAKKRFDEDPAFADRARQRVVALQGGDAATLRSWRFLIEESQRHFAEVYRRLNVELTDADTRPESFYNPQLAATVAELEAGGLTQVSDSAVVVFPPGFKNEEGKPLPLIVRKSDGGFLYATTDLAALRYRAHELHAQRIIYVTDARQKQHFAMVFKVAAMAGWLKGAESKDPHPNPLPQKGEGAGVKLEHVPFGTVLGEDNKPFKTRSGETVKLIDLLDEAQVRALKVVTDKNPQMPEEQRRQIARAVGIGAIKYADLANDRVKDYVFSWDRMLSFDGNTAPYLQYSYTRIRSIFRKADSDAGATAARDGAVTIAEPAERTLGLMLLQFPLAVQGVADALEPHRLCTYLYDLATAFHSFYENCPVLTAPDAATRSSRLALCDLTARTLARGLGLLGIDVVEQM